MRCREHLRVDLHSSQTDELKDHLVKTKAPRPLAIAIAEGIVGWYRPQLPNTSTTVQSHPSKNSPPKATHRPKRYRLGPHVLRPNLPDFQKFIMWTIPWAASHANTAPSPTGPPSSSRYSSTKSKINGNSESKHSTAATAPNTRSSFVHDSVPKLLDSTPELGLSWHSTTSSYHDHSPLS
jgi:hypothetical protein